ncbi:MAG: 3-hydroxyacyl-CoA dehydrogenase, partial [Planctomycetota bacterium]
VRMVGIVGAGLMGTAIAAAHLAADKEVILLDNNRDARQSARARVQEELRLQGCDSPQQAAAKLRTTDDVRELAECDLVVESILEQPDVKQALYRELEAVVSPDVPIATNTSTIPIRRLADTLQHPRRFIGLHFFHPVRHRSLVEVIPGVQTSPIIRDGVLRHAIAIGKQPIVVADGPGFVVNRLLMPYLNEALRLLQQGVPPEAIDAAAVEFGMAMGPLRIMDEIGLDTTLAAGRVIWEAFPDRVHISPILITLIKRKRLGRKTGVGFYRYTSTTSWESPGEPDETLKPLVDAWVDEPTTIPQADVAGRLILPVWLEAGRLLEERTAATPEIIDLGMVFGLGFPKDRGGLMYWAFRSGPEKLLAEARRLFEVPSPIPNSLMHPWR